MQIFLKLFYFIKLQKGKMFNDISSIATGLGISLWLFVIIAIWSCVWKLLALWKSARKKQVGWFVVLALVNTIGLLQILYYFVFSEMSSTKSKKKKSSKKKKKK